VFAFISISLRLLTLMRMHRSSAYAVKLFMLSSLSRRSNRSFRYVFHMNLSMETCRHPNYFFVAMHSGVLIWISRSSNKTKASCRRMLIFGNLLEEKRISTCGMRSKAPEHKSTKSQYISCLFWFLYYPLCGLLRLS